MVGPRGQRNTRNGVVECACGFKTRMRSRRPTQHCIEVPSVCVMSLFKSSFGTEDDGDERKDQLLDLTDRQVTSHDVVYLNVFE